MIVRDLKLDLLKDIREHEQMLFVSGPRQCGKTTLGQMVLEDVRAGRYWNYDIPEDRNLLSDRPAFYEEIDRPRGTKPLIVLDEIHKHPQWKNYLKGAFDRSRLEYRFLVTGSGRLDLYRKGGDSLAGRYLMYHLYPLTINELAVKRMSLEVFLDKPDELPEEGNDSWATWKTMESLSGFPEPFLKGSETFYRRWALPYLKLLVREDIRDLTQIRQVGQMEILASLLPRKVGSPLSINSLREDIKLSFDTLKTWIGVLGDFFYLFLISPWTRKVSRAIQKEPKLYLFNWAMVLEPSARFENMVALHLYRAVTNWTERGLGEFGIHYVRDRQKNEVDFLLEKDGKPFLLVETKLSETEPGPALLMMKRKLGIPAVQLVNINGVSRKVTRDGGQILIASADRWLASLP